MKREQIPTIDRRAELAFLYSVGVIHQDKTPREMKRYLLDLPNADKA